MQDSEHPLEETIEHLETVMNDRIENAKPLRMRDKRLAPHDGYPNYVTQLESDLVAALTVGERKSLAYLKLLKKELGK